MELSERYIQTLEREGYSAICERQDAPGQLHPEHSLPFRAAVLVTDGSLMFDFGDETKEIRATERFNIPADRSHSVTAGPEGAIYIYGEETKVDS